MEYLISLVLIVLSGLFSGLTLGFFTLDVHTLRRRAELGDADAKKVYPIRRRGNQLLSTLLLGNVAVNAVLSVYLGTIASGVVAAIVATALIFVFGEIVPQAVFARYALFFASSTAPLVRLLILLFSPITYPIAYILDRALGDEMPNYYSKKELMHIISEHEDAKESPIDRDEERILHGALQFSHKRADEVMTPASSVIAYPVTTVMSERFREELVEHGHSRYPVYAISKNPDDRHIVGILYAKDIMIEDEDVSIDNAEEAYEDSYLSARPNEFLDTLLAKMLKRRQHMAIVEDKAGTFKGVITLEDIIEEIIQQEIEDEDDD